MRRGFGNQSVRGDREGGLLKWCLPMSLRMGLFKERQAFPTWEEDKIQPVHPKGNQSRIFIGRTDAEAETPILWPPDAKNWLV